MSIEPAPDADIGLRAVDGRVPGRRGLATRRRLLDTLREMLETTSYRDLKVVDVAREPDRGERRIGPLGDPLERRQMRRDQSPVACTGRRREEDGMRLARLDVAEDDVSEDPAESRLRVELARRDHMEEEHVVAAGAERLHAALDRGRLAHEVRDHDGDARLRVAPGVGLEGCAEVVRARRPCGVEGGVDLPEGGALAEDGGRRLWSVAAEPREPDRVAKLHANVNTMRAGLTHLGFQLHDSPAAIIPIMIGDEAEAIAKSERLLELGVMVIGFGYPVVPKGQARLRVQVSAALESAHLQKALDAFAKL